MYTEYIAKEYGTWSTLDETLFNAKKYVEEIDEFPAGKFDLYYDLAAAVLSNDKFQITGGAYTEERDAIKIVDIEGKLGDVYYRFVIRFWWHAFKIRFRYGDMDVYKHDGSTFRLYKVQHYPYYPQDSNLRLFSDRVKEYLLTHVIKPENKRERTEIYPVQANEQDNQPNE